MTVNKIFAVLFSSHSVFADDQMHVSAATHKHKRILKHLFVHQPFQKYVEFKQSNRKKESLFEIYGRDRTWSSTQENKSKQTDEQKLSGVALMNPELVKASLL